ncbi:flagellar export chaperone FliS [Cellulomonas sp. McL0617]|uniref:flagellar export chaperone FliS n=1 Tax=Cellulomonas sp. McL0617 TaxID=3415675 RepID=UPI003CF777C5
MHSVRSQYAVAAVAVVGPARLLTMRYERMLLDVDRAVISFQAGRRVDGTQHLAHAQEIVAELMVSMQEGAWDGGPQLMSIYRHLLTALIEAGVTGDVDRTIACRGLILPLAEAWHEAVDQAAPAAGVAAVTPTRESVMSARLLGVG